ncbi:hypothetical protein KUM39_16540 [Streptomyces sp. J2-1]|uniref:hypothetical protein n=1 Tax=Streptomyces corallincola TaxID=2851888 RepID=UPI001C3930F9|nr:hypothetical protein [Streptomyces corallincola]MBV2355964.1 hypothetical protein [Streptomyces corallincola]
MADEQYKWLTREAAERLLRGRSPEPVEEPLPDQARRLARALEALSADPAPGPAPLPGEDAALAAFRAARERRVTGGTGGVTDAGTRAVAPVPPRGAGRADGRAVLGADAGLVRIGSPDRTGIRTRRSRPVRLSLLTLAAAAAFGGLALAAGTGVLPVPFRGGGPGPAVSVSAAESPGRSGAPSASSSPGTPGGAELPDGGTNGALSGDTSGGRTTDGYDDTVTGITPGAGDALTAPRRRAAESACRDLRAGRDPGAARRRALENLAGGSTRVGPYCGTLLAAHQSATGRNRVKGDAKAGDTHDTKDGRSNRTPREPRKQGSGSGSGGGNGKGKGGDKRGDGKGDGRGRDDDSRSHHHRPTRAPHQGHAPGHGPGHGHPHAVSGPPRAPAPPHEGRRPRTSPPEV